MSRTVDNITNETTEIIGVNTFFSWSTFPTTATSSPNIRVHIEDNFITLFFDQYTAAATQNKKFISPPGAIPLQYRLPFLAGTSNSQSFIQNIIVTNNSNNTEGIIILDSTGLITICASITNAAFTASGFCGYPSFSVSYMLA